MGEGNKNQTITLELSKWEVLMLQELTEDIDAGYAWMVELAKSLRQKALAAYRKPLMDAADYTDIVEQERKMWSGGPVEGYMVMAKKRELEFLYNVEEF